ncbi:MAG: phage tail protein [Pseudomonadota bacterium]|nr:phage tail protein [Pseudomonadota bacterium]
MISPWPVMAAGIPVGAVIAFAGPMGRDSALPRHGLASTEPWGWLLCDGRQLACQDYPELFAMLGYHYGGSGAQFALPDYRGVFLRGVDGGSGNDPDLSRRQAPGDGAASEVGSRQGDAVINHNHSYTKPEGETSAGPVGGTAVASLLPGQCTDALKSASCGELAQQSDFETRPCNVSVYYLIKFTSAGAGGQPRQGVHHGL